MNGGVTLPGSRWRALKVSWYEQVRPRWLDIRPLLLAIATIAVFVFGTIGFQQYVSDHHHPSSVIDSFYRTLTLFELDGYDVDPPIPWTMELARFLAPAIVGYAVFRGLVAVFRQQLELFGMRALGRNHVVVAGLGDMGFRLAAAFRGEGFRVVVIEIDETNGSIQSCRARGIAVLAGDARDPRLLAKACAGRARYLVAVTGADAGNVEVAVAAGRLSSQRRSGVLHALVHLDDAGLWRMLKAQSVARGAHRRLRLEFFNVFETGARVLLDEHPPFAPDAAHPHVLVAGLENLGESLVLGIVRLWSTGEPAAGHRLQLTLVGDDAETEREQLLANYPALGDLCELRAVGSAAGAELQTAQLGDQPVSAIYVCLSDEAKALEAALALRARRDLHSVPVVVSVRDAGTGLASVLRDDPQTAQGVSVFGTFNRTLQVAPLVRGTNELLARSKHEEYVRNQLARGVALGEGLMVPWDQLPESWKDANRAFADGIGAALEAAGCVLVPSPLADPDRPPFSFTDAEVEALARREHERWMADKLENGWRYAAVRDNAAKLHPSIVDWAQLSEVERDKDREPVREIPRMLARAGFEIIRTASAPQSPAVATSAP